MNRSRICLTLTESTLEADLNILNKYRKYIDIVELRADFLESDERLYVRRFPKLAGLPCVLTYRRQIDGGNFVEGEAARTILFARALAFAESDKSKNFQYVDFEEDFYVPSLQDAALAFGTKIIRSVHDMEKPIYDIKGRLESLRKTGYEIPKIAFMPHSLADVQHLFEEANKLDDDNHILIAMGPLGVPSRILATRLKNYLTYSSPVESNSNLANLNHLDPINMQNLYHFDSIDSSTKIFGITGWPLTATSSPALHNQGYHRKNINAVYIPIKSEKFVEALSFADALGIQGMSVTIPHKEAVLQNVMNIDQEVQEIGASNTVVKENGEWYAHNTDSAGFTRALLEFTGLKSLAHKKVAIIGAGGAAKAVAYAVKKLHGNACVFNRTVSRARELAEQFGFKYAPLSNDSYMMLRKYSSIIIQTTSKGMNSKLPATEENDPLYFYSFSGKEMLIDIVYVPSVTPVMARAAEAGCRVCNGYSMLKYQGYDQFKYFTGVSIED